MDEESLETLSTPDGGDMADALGPDLRTNAVTPAKCAVQLAVTEGLGGEDALAKCLDKTTTPGQVAVRDLAAPSFVELAKQAGGSGCPSPSGAKEAERAGLRRAAELEGWKTQVEGVERAKETLTSVVEGHQLMTLRALRRELRESSYVAGVERRSRLLGVTRGRGEESRVYRKIITMFGMQVGIRNSWGTSTRCTDVREGGQ